MKSPRPSIARSLGEFFGHIFRGLKAEVDDEGNEVQRDEVSRTVEEEHIDSGVTLRRTTIEEVEYRPGHDKSPSSSTDK